MFTKIEATFVDEISGLVIVKTLDKKAQSTLILKLKFVRYTASLDVTNSVEAYFLYNRIIFLKNTSFHQSNRSGFL